MGKINLKLTMAVSENECGMIIRYLDNELPEEEEVLFVKQLSENKELQQALDIELMLRNEYLEEADETLTNNSDIMFEPADTFLKRAEATIPRYKHQNKPATKTPVVWLRNKIKTASIAAAILIAVASFFYFINTSRNNRVAVNNYKQKIQAKRNQYFKDTTPAVSAYNSADSIPDDKLLSQLSIDQYKRYNPVEDEPAEIGICSQSYTVKKYTDVMKTTENDIATKGSYSDNEQNILQHYLLFYKALSYIETANPAKGAALLYKIIKKTSEQNRLYYQSQYYLLMAYMRMNDRKNTEALLSSIINAKNNPNRKTALGIIRKIEEK